MFFTAQVEVYLNVIEVVQQQIQFRLETGTFDDFAADLSLQDCQDGTLLTYAVQATPNIPIPTMFIQQAMQLELPANYAKNAPGYLWRLRRQLLWTRAKVFYRLLFVW